MFPFPTPSFRRRAAGWFAGLLLVPLALPVVSAADAAAARPATDTPALKDAARGLFRVGAALNAAQIDGSDAAGAALVATHFDSITAENVMKWERIHPAPDRWEFALPDRFVALGEAHGQQIIGHTLMWHAQTPKWVFEDAAGKPLTKAALLERLREHVRTVVGRYRGRVHGWDVVNEAIRDDDGRLRTDKPWYAILGEDGVFAAFEAAHAADPAAELYYNDYAVENPVKRAGILKLVQALRARGLRIDGVGSQGHYGLAWPTLAEVDAGIADFTRAGFKVMITELDVTVLPRPDNYAGAEVSRRFEATKESNPFPDGLPAAIEAQLARRYVELFGVFAKHRGVTRVTLWGVTDRTSWLNHWPIRGRTDYPLLFDRANQPKPALRGVATLLQAVPRESGGEAAVGEPAPKR